MHLSPTSQEVEAEPQDPTRVFGNLTWQRLGQVLQSHAGSPANRLTVHLLTTAQSQARRWSEDELCVEIVLIVAIALQRPLETFERYGVESSPGASTMT